MAKKNYIRIEFDTPAFVVGIASNEKIWKVVWSINQCLNLNLATGILDVTSTQNPEIYQDMESDPDFEYALFENTEKGKKVPKKAKEFRFWLTIKPKKSKSPDLDQLITQLKTIKQLSLLADLSDEDEIKSFIP